MDDPSFTGPDFVRGHGGGACSRHADPRTCRWPCEVERAAGRLSAGRRRAGSQRPGGRPTALLHRRRRRRLLCDGEGEASNLRFSGVLPGDEVHVDNRAFLAYCYYYRHHLRDTAEYDFLRSTATRSTNSTNEPEMSPFMGVPHTGRFEGKMLWVHHTHDASLWPSQGIGHEEQRRA